MAKIKNLSYDGVGFNADWVASIRTEKQFLARQELIHLFPGLDPEAKVQALKEVYALCKKMVNPETPVPIAEPSPDKPKDGD